MLIGIKDGLKLFGIIIVSFCAVFVCTLFLNYYVDALAAGAGVSEQAQVLYDAQVAMARFVCMITGGCLCLTAVVMLVFYIKLYIDGNIKRFGLLKAMGYSDGRIAVSFWIFGFAVLIGSAAGYGVGCAAMSFIYKEMAIDGMTEITVHFHAWLPVALVIAPTAAFSALSCLYARVSLKRSVAAMLKGVSERRGKIKVAQKDRPFLSDMRSSVLRAKKSAVFFVAFSCFCFSSMLQMGLSMRDLSSVTMGTMIISIGVVLSVTALIMAVTTVVNGNARGLAVMKAFGYTRLERAVAVLFGYVPFAAIGYAVGTVYQYALLKLMVEFMFDGVAGIPEYSFDVPAFFVVLALFIVVYAAAMYVFSRRIEKISVKLASAAE